MRSFPYPLVRWSATALAPAIAITFGAINNSSLQPSSNNTTRSESRRIFSGLISKNRKSSDDKKKNVIVVGGGVVGVTAAYKLALAGHSVTVLEPRTEPGQECSACAAGGMQKSNPTVDRNTWVAVLKSTAPGLIPLWQGQDFKFFHIDWGETITDPFFLRWLFTFTMTSLLPSPDQEKKQEDMLNFTKFAVEDMIKMMKDPKDKMAKKSGYNSQGSLGLSYEPAPAPAVSGGEDKNASSNDYNHSSSKRVLEPFKKVEEDEIISLEPSILFQQQKPTTARYEFEASAASSERFTMELAERCVTDPALDVTFLYETRVTAIQADTPPTSSKPRISRLHTNNGQIDVPEDSEILVAAGAWVPHILALLDLYCPVYPLKGYAMSMSANEVLKESKKLSPQDLPSRIVSDKYMYTSRLGDEIRITSIGEFSGWSTKPTPTVDIGFRIEAARQFPQLKEFIDRAATRCGHRPYVSDGILLLGRVDTYENLLLSCGPGSNGWKLAMGSGEVIERLVSGQTEEQISDDLGCNVKTFSPSGRVLNAPIFSCICRARWGI
mmetsp:Transcript_43950/g.106556  ORF Transcript_43950/g.106556 Transcript_43950/m.106556 type:complete len:552 (-) Transcript_43950:141-1796(-)